MNKAIGIIGFGNMGSAIAKGLKERYNIWVFDKDKSKITGIDKINVAGGISELINKADVLLLAVKPQDFDLVLEEVKNGIACLRAVPAPRRGRQATYRQTDKLIISLAAGITTAYLEKKLGPACRGAGRKVRVIRVMPNLGVKIGQSVTSLSQGRFVSEEDFGFAEKLFSCLGTTRRIKEDLMNAATAISGSGPAYIYYDMELNSLNHFNISKVKKNDYIIRLTQAAEVVGFASGETKQLALDTVESSLNMLKETGLSPLELRKQITSKGGTTEAALAVLEKGGSWSDAALAAIKRAKELSKET